LESGGVGGAQSPLQVEIRGPDVNELQRVTAMVMRAMESIPGIVDVSNSMGEPRPEYRIVVDRDKANEVGLDIGRIAGTVRPLVAGQTATRWEDPSGEEREVVVQIDPAQRVTVEDLARLPLAVMQRTDYGAALTVPLGEVARIEEGVAPAQIDRKDLSRL